MDCFESYAKQYRGRQYRDNECTRTAREIFHYLGVVAAVAACDVGPAGVPLRFCIDGTFCVGEVLRRAGLWTDRS